MQQASDTPEKRFLPKPAWHVYILRCRDGSYYTGITTDLKRRLREHNSVKGGARYTRARQPVTLVYSEAVADRSAAACREYRIKQLSPPAKRRLVSQFLLSVTAGTAEDTPAGCFSREES